MDNAESHPDDVTLSQPDDVTTVAISSRWRIPNADDLGHGGMWSEWVTTISGSHEDIQNHLQVIWSSIFKFFHPRWCVSDFVYSDAVIQFLHIKSFSAWLKLTPNAACWLLLITGIAANSARFWDDNHVSQLMRGKLLEIECYTNQILYKVRRRGFLVTSTFHNSVHELWK